MKICKLLPLLLLSSHLAHAEDSKPYFAGTLLSGIPVNVAPSHWLIEPYFYAIQQTGVYNSHWNLSDRPQFFTIQMPWEFETGITHWLDIAFYPTFYDTPSSWLYGDTKLAFGFQILREEKNTSLPNLRFILQESFPTGKYDHLSPHQHLADASGTGAYSTWLSSVLQKTFSVFTLNLTIDYIVFSSVTVKGYSVYGGPAHATLRPGHQLLTNIGIEYSLTQRWILGLDIHYQHQNSSSHPTPSVGQPSLEQLSLAPCLEYNPSPHFSIEAGSWFTLAGRNSAAFITGAVTAYWFF
jgi:hypothetical protein